MRKLNVLTPIELFPGEPLLDVEGHTILIAVTLATIVKRGSSEDPALADAIANRIRFAKNVLQLDEAEFRLVEQCVIADRSMANFARKACLDILAAAEMVTEGETRAETRRKKGSVAVM